MIDCSWCADEMGVEPTKSPTICPRHSEQVLAEARAYRASARHVGIGQETFNPIDTMTEHDVARINASVMSKLFG
jgi:hypothetical protein